MRTFRTILAVGALAYLIYNLFELNYKDLSWQANKSNYLYIIFMVIIIISMIYSIRYDAKRRKKI